MTEAAERTDAKRRAGYARSARLAKEAAREAERAAVREKADQQRKAEAIKAVEQRNTQARKRASGSSRSFLDGRPPIHAGRPSGSLHTFRGIGCVPSLPLALGCQNRVRDLGSVIHGAPVEILREQR
jgi:hypothetical protein